MNTKWLQEQKDVGPWRQKISRRMSHTLINLLFYTKSANILYHYHYFITIIIIERLLPMKTRSLVSLIPNQEQSIKELTWYILTYANIYTMLPKQHDLIKFVQPDLTSGMFSTITFREELDSSCKSSECLNLSVKYLGMNWLIRISNKAN